MQLQQHLIQHRASQIEECRLKEMREAQNLQLTSQSHLANAQTMQRSENDQLSDGFSDRSSPPGNQSQHASPSNQSNLSPSNHNTTPPPILPTENRRKRKSSFPVMCVQGPFHSRPPSAIMPPSQVEEDEEIDVDEPVSEANASASLMAHEIERLSQNKFKAREEVIQPISQHSPAAFTFSHAMSQEQQNKMYPPSRSADLFASSFNQQNSSQAHGLMPQDIRSESETPNASGFPVLPNPETLKNFLTLVARQKEALQTAAVSLLKHCFLIHYSRSTVTAGSVHCFRTSPSVRPHFSKSSKTKQIQLITMFTTGETMGLAEWIIDDTYLVTNCFLILIFF